MLQKSNIQVILFSLLLSLSTHLFVLAPTIVTLADYSTHTPDSEDEQQSEPEKPRVNKIKVLEMKTFKFGMDHPTEFVLVEHMGHDAPKPLKAELSVTVQPAYQEDAPPKPEAVATVNPTTIDPSKVNPTTDNTSDTNSIAAVKGDVQDVPVQEMAIAPVTAGKDSLTDDDKAQMDKVTSAEEEIKESAPMQFEGIPWTQVQPTVIPQVEKHLDPTELVELDDTIVTGRVLSGEGLQLTSAAPDVSVVTLVSSAPLNPEVRLVFSPKGKVIDAKILKSTGYEDWDAALLANMYKWKLSGEGLAKLDGPVYKELTIILSRNAPGKY